MNRKQMISFRKEEARTYRGSVSRNFHEGGVKRVKSSNYKKLDPDYCLVPDGFYRNGVGSGQPIYG